MLLSRIIFAITCCLPVAVHGQSVYVDLVGGGTWSQLQTRVNSLVVQDGILTANRWNGGTPNWDLSTVQRIRFHDLATATSEASNGRAWNAYTAVNGDLLVDVDLDAASTVQIEVFDALGRPLRSSTQNVAQGQHTLRLEGTCTSGVYHCRITAGDRSMVRSIASITP